MDAALQFASKDKGARFLAPKQFHEFLHAFEKGKDPRPPPHRPYDHSISLKPDSAPAFGPLYGMPHKELLVLKEYIADKLSKGFIRHSSPPRGRTRPIR